MRSHLPLVFLFQFCVFIFAFSVNAQQSSIQQSLLTGAQKKIWKVSSSVASSSNLRPVEATDSQSELSWSITPQIQLNSELALRARVSGSQQTNRQQKSTLDNTKISLRSKVISLNDKVQLLPQISALAPTNSDLRDDQTYQGGMALEPIFISNFSILNQGITTIYAMSLGRSFHQVSRASNGESNIEYNLSQSLVLETALHRRLNLSLAGGFLVGRTYSGRNRNTYSITEELSFQMNKVSWLAIGHTYGANVLGPDGKSQDLRFFSQRDSIVFASLSLSI